MKALEAKITSKDQLIEIIGQYTYDRTAASIGLQRFVKGSDIGWWAIREHLRISTEVYTTTESCTLLNKISQGFVHISKTDNNMVAFTPDRVAGEADRQVITTFGRVASKLLPVCTEDFVRNLAENHAGDVSNSFELVTGSDIAAVYADPKTVHSCMVAKHVEPGRFNPMLAYSVEGVAMAVLRDLQGNVNARSMVRHVGTDKFYIRPYGDPKLERRLKAAGYVCSGWVGTVFPKLINKAVEWDDAKDADCETVAMPYLDSFGGAASHKGSTIINTEEGIRCIGEQERADLLAAGLERFVQTGSASSGQIKLALLKPEHLNYVDELSGESVSRLKNGPPKSYIKDDETYGECSSTSALKAGYKFAKTYINGGVCEVFVRPETPVFVCKDYSTYIDTAENRTVRGWELLEPEFYGTPEQREAHPADFNHRGERWTRDGVSRVLLTDSEGCKKYSTVLTRETYFVVVGGVLETGFGKPNPKWKRLHKGNAARDAYFDPKTEKVARTVSGKAVHKNYSDVVELYDGRLEFSRNCVMRRLSPLNYENEWHLRRPSPEEVTRLANFVAKYEADLMEQAYMDSAFKACAWSILEPFGEGHLMVRTADDKIRSAYNHATSDYGTAAYVEFLAALADALPRRSGARNQELIQKTSQFLLRKWAEMNAVDYNTLPTSSTETKEQELSHDESAAVSAQPSNLVAISRPEPIAEWLGQEAREAEAVPQDADAERGQAESEDHAV